jgi:hypothetical protein
MTPSGDRAGARSRQDGELRAIGPGNGVNGEMINVMIVKVMIEGWRISKSRAHGNHHRFPGSCVTHPIRRGLHLCCWHRPVQNLNNIIEIVFTQMTKRRHLWWRRSPRREKHFGLTT